MKRILFFLLCLTLTIAANARTRNENLRTQFKDDSLRVLPKSDFYVVGADPLFFYRFAEKETDIAGYYHAGFWFPVFVEINPREPISLNAKIVTYNPAYSYGTTTTTAIMPFVSMAYQDNLKNYFENADVELYGRFGDLDRVTLGAGLTLDDKEMSGSDTWFSWGPAKFRHVFDATGGYDRPGDLHYSSVDLWHDLIGAYQFGTYVKGPLKDYFFTGFYSTHELFQGFRYSLEAATRNNVWAKMAALSFDKSWNDALFVRAKAQARNYESDFALGHKRSIEHDFLSIEMEDKEFTDSMNIFVIDDDVNVYSGVLNARFKFWQRFAIFSENESGTFFYKRAAPQRYFYWKHGAAYYPRGHDNEVVTVYYGNKVVNATGQLNSPEDQNIFTFYMLNYVGVDALFAF